MYALAITQAKKALTGLVHESGGFRDLIYKLGCRAEEFGNRAPGKYCRDDTSALAFEVDPF